jgi:protein-tyrosine phosphatase
LIDLHCHLVPGIDDGSKSLRMSMEMARLAVADGTTVLACTPHVMPPVYDNRGPIIKAAVDVLRKAIALAELPLRLVAGADVHVAPDLVAGLRDGRIPTLGDSRYLLLEPPHHVPPPRLAECIFGLNTAGYVAILTHPERLSWIESQYQLIVQLAQTGTLMQVTAGSLTGRFGRRPRYWAERLLDEGICHVLASDAHDPENRPPLLAEGRDAAAKRVGEEEATRLVVTRPQAILDDVSPGQLAAVASEHGAVESPAGWRRIWQRFARAGGVG